MLPITRKGLTEMVPRKEKKSFHLPADFDDINWGETEFLGWVHRSGHKGYILEDLSGAHYLWVFEVNRPDALARGPSVCDICLSVRGQQRISLFTAPVQGAPNITRGFRACANLRCPWNIKEPSPDSFRETISLEDKRVRILTKLEAILAAFKER